MKEGNIYPLSAQQKGIFAEIGLEESSSLFHIAKILELKSSVEIDRIRESFFHLLNRHEGLRVQIMKEEASQVIRGPNLRAFSSIQIPQEELYRYLEKRVKIPFDLLNDPLFTLTHIRTDSDRSFLLILGHHLVTDLWSVGVFLDELFSLLDHQQLSYTPKSYLEFVEEQQTELSLDKGKNLLNYWKEAFKQFPLEHNAIPSSANVKKRGETPQIEVFEIPKSISSSIFDLARKERLQVVSLLLTIYSYLFFLRTGKKQFCIGTTSNGRLNVKWAHTLGLFSNPVPLMISISPSASFIEDSRLIQKQLIAHLKRFQLPLSYLVENLRKEGCIESDSICKHLFVYQQVPSVSGELKKLSLPGLETDIYWRGHHLGSIDWNHPFSPYELTFYMHELDGHLKGFVEYEPQRYPIDFVKEIIQEFKTLCSFFSGDPSLKIADFDLVKGVSRQHETKGVLILDKLKLWAELKTDQLIYSEGLRGVTYGQFEKWTNKVARMLLHKGLLPGDCLTLQMNHTLETYLVMVATWKCGAAFVPIDITTSAEQAEKIRKMSDSQWLIKNLDLGEAASYSDQELPPLVDSSFPAYLIFTSGSTGLPKGVVVSHENLSSYLEAIGEAYPFDPPVHFAVHSSLSFDLTITSQFYPLYAGQTAHLFNRELELNDLFCQILSHPLLTHFKCTPSHLKCLQWIDVPKSGIKVLIVGGEALLKSTVLAIQTKFICQPTIINEYGPSEVTVGCIYQSVTADYEHDRIPIGMPLKNSNALVLGPFLHNVPNGVEAPLYLMGNGVTLGYKKDPKKTAEVFLPDLFTRGKRMYDSGDIAFTNSKGQFEFISRTDTQVKIRGHRIELEEIQEALQKCTLVKENFVCVIEDSLDEEKILAAFVVLKGLEGIEPVVKHLNGSIPSYMVPTRIIECEEIPLTPNGKVDERKLKKLLKENKKTIFQKGIDPIQQKLIEIWSSVLKIDPSAIDVMESFFSLGGDSIKAIQIVALAKKAGILISVKDILGKRTIQAIAACSKLKNEHLVFEEPKWVSLTPIQQWFFSRIQGNIHHYNQAVLLKDFRISDPTILRDTICKIAKNQPLMRSIFPDRDRAKIVSIEEFEKNFSLIEKHLSPLELTEEIAKLQSDLNIEKGPLIRVGAFWVEGNLNTVIVMHHLITDGVSWHLFLDALKSGLKGEPINNPATQSMLPSNKTFNTPELSNTQPKLYRVNRQRKLQISVDLNRNNFNNKQFGNEALELLGSGASTLVREQVASKEPKFSTTAPSSKKDSSSSLGIASLKKERGYFSYLEDLSFAAFSNSYFNIVNVESEIFQIERHGRVISGKEEDFSSLIGWFTQLKTCHLSFKNNNSLLEKLQIARDALTRDQTFQTDPVILFNYLGEIPSNLDQEFTAEPITDGLIDSDSSIPYHLQLNLWVNQGTLIGEFIFDTDTFPSDVQEKFLTAFIATFELFLKQVFETVELPSIPKDFDSNIPLEEFKGLIDRFNYSRNQIHQILPLLPSEKGIFLHSLTHPQSIEYFQQLVLDLEGAIDERVLLTAYCDCIHQFPSLRSTFHLKGLHEPQKVIHRDGVHQIEKFSDLVSYLEADRRRIFSLERLPLIRLGYRINEKRTQLVLSFHHLVMDGWSLAIVFDELLRHLGSPSSKGKVLFPLKFIPLNTIDQSTNYWKKLLSRLDLLTHLPKERGNTDQNIIQEKKIREFDSLTSSFLVKTCQKNGVTIAHLFHAVWAYLLSVFLNNQQVAFGTVVSGRSQLSQELENQVGQLSSIIPVIVRVKPNMTLLDIANEIQDQIQESEQHLGLSTGEIEALSPVGLDLIDHILIIENYPFSGQAEQLIKSHQLPFNIISSELIEQSQYPFALSFFPNENLTIECQFDRYRINPCWVESVMNSFKTLFNSELNLLERPIRSLSIASEPLESRRLKENCIKSIPEQFKDDWDFKRNRIAVVDGDHQITYETLDLLSNRVAISLLCLGIQADENIGIALERSIKWIIVWLGILKAGAAYTPLRLEDPLQRKKMVLEKAKIRFLVTDEQADSTKLDVEIFNFEKLISFDLKNDFSLPSIDPKQLAYTLFTSGTTGIPKGIAMPHEAIMNHFNWIVQEFELKAEDRMLQLTAYSFDVSVCELYALLVGGTLILAPDSADKNLSLLQRTVENNQVTFIQMVPSLLEAIVSNKTKNSFHTVRQVLCGADILHPHQLEKWLNEVDIPLSNLYGLTETCIDSTHFPCSQHDGKLQSIPIGKAIRNVWTYHLDDWLNCLPSYAKGNLFIGGEGIARCYLERPDLTAERFLPDPFSPGKRMFSSYDQVSVDSKGNFYFAGRVDNQVKIRGLRVELDEIRAVASRMAGIEEVFIKVIGKTPSESICCYFKSDYVIEEQKMRDFIKQHLPAFMVPSFYVQVQEFPLNPSGKIDRHALPEPAIEKRSLRKITSSEEQIAKSFSEVLQIDLGDIDPEANFFDMGGNSLSLMKLHYQMEEAGYCLSVTTLFQYPSIRQLSQFLNQNFKDQVDLEDADERARKRRLKKLTRV
ncbi:MAG: amino acid adenylation domain-containing protein [Verrucomicrobia bacterium]|nr:amino acid adenylation domain-containing protein [Verrucomicrobiota bacterium]